MTAFQAWDGRATDRKLKVSNDTHQWAELILHAVLSKAEESLEAQSSMGKWQQPPITKVSSGKQALTFKKKGGDINKRSGSHDFRVSTGGWKEAMTEEQKRWAEGREKEK